jgi:hypothetical protein
MHKILLSLLCFVSLSLGATVHFQNYDTDPRSGIEIEYSYLFDSVDQEQAGTRVPLLIRINNLTDSSKSWDLQTESGWGDDSDILKTQISVEARSTRLFTLEAPLGDFTEHSSLPRIQINGYGVNAGRFVGSGSSVSNYEGKVASRKAYKLLKSPGDENYYGYGFVESSELQYFPTRWSSYSSLRAILLTGQEFSNLRDEQKSALREWVISGGLLQLIDLKNRDQEEAVLEFFSVDKSGSVGMGTLLFFEQLSSPKFPFGAIDVEQEFHNESIADMEKTVKEPGVSLFLVGVLLSVFLIIVGPYNLYVLTKKNRLRLLVTTPIISLAASLLYAFIIILYDGFGASGEKSSMVWIEPDQKRCVISQSQIMKSGIMLNSTIKRESDYLVYAYRANRYEDYEQVKILMDGEWLGGDVFNSRSRRFMELKDIRTTQASLEWLGGDEPSLRSNFQSTLSELLIRDKQGEDWYAEKCAPGETVKLRKVSVSDAAKMHHRDVFNRMKAYKKGYFICKSMNDQQFDIATHEGIDWKQDRFVIGGSLAMGEK